MNDPSSHRGVPTPLAPPLPARGERLAWSRLYGSARALAVANAALASGRTTLVVAPDAHEAERWVDELGFYLRGRGPEVRLFPGWEVLPWDTLSPDADLVSERLALLSGLADGGHRLVVVAADTLLQRLAPPAHVHACAMVLRAGERLDRDAFIERLVSVGYRRVPQVMEHGELAVRGSLIDVFPMGAPCPVRIDLFDDEVESLRRFDAETQRSTGELGELRVLPASELPFTEAGVATFRRNWRRRFAGNPTDSPVYRDVSRGLRPGGVEFYLPLFFDATATLPDYLPADALVVLDEGVAAAVQAFRERLAERHAARAIDAARPLLDPDELFLDAEGLAGALAPLAQVLIEPFDGGAGVALGTRAPVQVPVDVRSAAPLATLERHLEARPARVLLVAESEGRRETVRELLERHGMRPRVVAGWQEFLEGEAPLALTAGALRAGAVLDAPALEVICEAQLFGERVAAPRRRARRRDAEAVLEDLNELHEGDPVVHEHHGVGRYRGLVTLEVDGIAAEFITLEYADGDKLYVPVSSLHLISRYAGASPDTAPLHKLGSGQWERARARAAKRAHDVAAELVDIQARRLARRRRPFTIDADAMRAFAEAFPFEETPDQASAIAAVLDDMTSERPMDRVICGDSGFGKTEVAMRAAFAAAMDGRQVAVLVPTTLLAEQHFQNFRDRFADWPVKVASLSRFRSRSEVADTLDALASGQIDIVVGTHKLLGREVRFANLGLVVIDEEHRFGVRQKERLKRLRAEVDVLTLTATPIPRTLSMALAGVRELSLIATAPARRVPIRTFVREWDEELVREAVLRELARGGQVFFVHNRVETIEQMAAELAALVPEASIRIGHGQMREQELEQVMLDFYHQRFNVLVCSTIIETGIDIPSANTIIINRADRFGLAQLYQLRGRVGRSHHRGYAWLMIPSRDAIGADAAKRLQAIESLEDLGIGFTLATHDLEIRGAGELLGEGQSGHIEAVGYAQYMQMLERAVAALRAGREPAVEAPTQAVEEVDVRAPMLLPEDWLPDVNARLSLYKRIAAADSEEALAQLREEMIDRLGPLPEPAANLLRAAELKLAARRIGVQRVELGARGGRIVFDAAARVDPARVVRLVQGAPETYGFSGGTTLRVRAELPDAGQRLDLAARLLAELEARDAA